ncbi:MAG: DNA polymerase IV [Firmicutes bacterium]|nr:DNA polymerase IV [Bacillota bacterium]
MEKREARERNILHSDLNNFFASVEEILNPSLRAHPLVVGGDPSKRSGIVLAKNQLAKKYGIFTGETLFAARKKCPNLVVVPGRSGVYGEYSKKVNEIYSRYSDRVESFGIDECWLDITGLLDEKGNRRNPREVADEIRETVKRELGLTVSIGVSFNKTFAKLASDFKKPDATSEVTKENFKELVWRLPVNDMMYVGRRMAPHFRKMTIETIGDLANFSPVHLEKRFGINGRKLWELANGIDDSTVALYQETELPKSVGNSRTFSHDLTTVEEIKCALTVLAESVARRSRRKGVKGVGVALSVRDENLKWWKKQGMLGFATNNSKTILDAGMELLKHYDKPLKVHSLGITLFSLVEESKEQLSIFGMEEKNKTECVLDKVQIKYGRKAIVAGTTQVDKEISDFMPSQKKLV